MINLSVDKPAVLIEIARVLKPGGRGGVSDIVAENDLSPADRAERGSHVAGALSKSEHIAGLEAAGVRSFRNGVREIRDAIATHLHDLVVDLDRERSAA